jgi:hypothetical protein
MTSNCCGLAIQAQAAVAEHDLDLWPGFRA